MRAAPLFFTLLTVVSAQLSAESKIIAITGSLREGSYNKKLLKEAVDMARQSGATVNEIDLRDFPMPFFDEDLEKTTGMPANAKRFRDQMISSDGVIIATPEYNSSISAVLKNALDWASRSEDGKPSRDAFKGKKFAIMSASQGPGGGVNALAHLKAVIKNAGGEIVALETSVPMAQKVFNLNGNLENGPIKDKLKEEINELVAAK